MRAEVCTSSWHQRKRCGAFVRLQCDLQQVRQTTSQVRVSCELWKICRLSVAGRWVWRT